MNVLLHHQAVVQACHQEDHMGITLPDVHRHHHCCIMCCCLPQHISIVASPWMVTPETLNHIHVNMKTKKQNLTIDIRLHVAQN